MITRRRETRAGVVLLVIAMILTVAPLASLLSAALQPQGTIPLGFQWPRQPHWSNLADAYVAAELTHLLFSSSVIAAGVVPISLVLATMAGFALGRLRIRGSGVVLVVLLLGLVIPFESIVTPLYYEIQTMGLLNSRWAIILPLIGLFMPFSILWMRAHFLATPRELSEAARIDGASPLQELLHIQLPLARPPLTALAIILFLWSWNEFLLSIVLVDDPLKRTMAGALGAFQGQYGTDLVLLAAGTILIVTPTILIFLIFQRHFVGALIQGAVKG